MELVLYFCASLSSAGFLHAQRAHASLWQEEPCYRSSRIIASLQGETLQVVHTGRLSRLVLLVRDLALLATRVQSTSTHICFRSILASLGDRYYLFMFCTILRMIYTIRDSEQIFFAQNIFQKM